jgi:hypothetical protein
MKRHAIEYTKTWTPGPMSFWVHVETKPRRRDRVRKFTPPLPKPVPGKGYARYFVEVDGLVFEFASLDELDVCIATLSEKAFRPTDRETQARGTGPTQHWLNRLPPGTHNWRYRQKAVKALEQARKDFREQVAARRTGNKAPRPRAARTGATRPRRKQLQENVDWERGRA